MSELIFKMLLYGWLGVGVLMLILWFIHLIIKNAGIVVIGWAAGLAFIVGVYFIMGE